MTELTVHLTFSVEAPWGNVHVRWEEPARLSVVIFHLDPAPPLDAPAGVAYAESLFVAAIKRGADNHLVVRAWHSEDTIYGCVPDLAARVIVEQSEMFNWERRVGHWLERWIVSKSAQTDLQCAIAHHNKYVMLHADYAKCPPKRREHARRRMLRCIVDALPAALFLLQQDRLPLREWAMLHYLPLVGRRRGTLSAAALNLPGVSRG